MSFIPKALDERDPLERQQKDIERRRRQENERKKRFFDDKQRIMGLDMKGLAKQVEEKKQRQKQEKDDDINYSKQVTNFMDKMYQIAEERNKIAKQHAYQVGQYQHNTKKELTDTWDLNDPTLNRNTQPPRVSDKDNIHVSSLQKFDGEDLGFRKRQRTQQQDMTQWCKDSKQEKLLKLEQQKAEALAYDQQLMQTIKKSDELEMEKQKLHKQSLVNTAQYNLQQKNEKEKHAKQMFQASEKQKADEIKTLMNSDWLTENWDATLRAKYNHSDASFNNTDALNSKIEHRHIPYHFKGFNKQQRQEIMNQQKQQIEEHLRQQQLDQENIAKDNEQQNEYTRQALLQLRKLKRVKLEQKCNLAQTQQHQIKQTEQQRKQMNELYANKVTEAYFSQFQTSAR